ncbi:porin family protein [Agarilytica rhodophyticola]|uniref:porin family protein n=1 Tax=Agarilytica rhodophyticola TaxID=1737490 RepID=UPI000B34998F|nr:porin family protein [Agarilytica rhodophyticola]
MKRFLIAILSIFVVTNVYASKDKGVYVGGGITIINVGIQDPFSKDVNFKAGEIILGYKYNSYLGIEVRGGGSLSDERIALTNTTRSRDSAESDIENYASVYYRAELSNEIAKLYLLLGQSTISTRVRFEDGTTPAFEASESGWSYGAGFGLWLDERMNLNFEVKTLVDTENDSFTSVGINADYRF